MCDATQDLSGYTGRVCWSGGPGPVVPVQLDWSTSTSPVVPVRYTFGSVTKILLMVAELAIKVEQMVQRPRGIHVCVCCSSLKPVPPPQSITPAVAITLHHRPKYPAPYLCHCPYLGQHLHRGQPITHASTNSPASANISPKARSPLPWP